MIPLRVYVENFMSYRQGQEIVFDDTPLWVLAGPNGAGKSTIFDAIRFALYGVHRAGGKQNAKHLINHKADSLTVEFDFRVDNLIYRIRRIISKQGRATREVFYLSEDSKSIKKPVPDTDNDSGFNKWIKQTIGLDEKAFTSSILLLQGQSDKLLTVEPKDRYEILKQFINLSAYERLYEKADNIRKEIDGQIKGLKIQLEEMPLVQQKELNNLENQVTEAQKEWQLIQQKVDSLTQLLEKSKMWKQLNRQILQQQEELKGFQSLIALSNEINRKFIKFQELKQVLPLLNQIVKQRDRLIQYNQHNEILEKSSQELKRNLEEQEFLKTEAEKQVEKLLTNIEELHNQKIVLAEQLSKLDPLIEKLTRFKSIQEQLNECDQKIAHFPSNLVQLVQQAEEQSQKLLEIEKVLPWLKQLSLFRIKLADALSTQKTSSQSLIDLDTQINEKNNQLDQLNYELKIAQEEERCLTNEITRTQTKYDEVYQRKTRFDKAAHEAICELCGQEITPEHAQQEEQRLNLQITKNKNHLAHLNIEHQEFQNYLKELESSLNHHHQILNRLLEKSNKAKNQYQQAQKEANHNLKELNKAFSYLSATYQVPINADVPSTELEWLATHYPTENDLEKLKQELKLCNSHAKTIKDLQQQLAGWQKLNSQREIYEQQLQDIKKNISLSEARQAQSQQLDLQQAQKQLDLQLQGYKKQQSQSKAQAAKMNQIVSQLTNELQQSQKTLGENRVLQIEIQRSLKSKLESLPEYWQEDAQIIETDELQEIEHQQNELSHYENLARKLNEAYQSVTHIEKQINTLKAEIEVLPTEAQRSANEIEQELNKTKTERYLLDENRRKIELELEQLRDRQNRRQKLEKDLKQLEYQNHLYKQVSKLLGKEGIQLELLRNAEKTIIELANQILYNLSRGRMKLELRSEEPEFKAQSNKALDLVAYNYDTGERPTAVALTSGSQRFRIAVSLALAIGQYAGQGARCIKSVIIDEGFGSLDKNGRDDMIQELNELRQHLERIILVSHQEEFFSAFTNGYTVELVNGASRVSLIEPA